MTGCGSCGAIAAAATDGMWADHWTPVPFEPGEAVEPILDPIGSEAGRQIVQTMKEVNLPFRPLFNQVVILPHPDTVQTGSIVIPETGERAEELRRSGRYHHTGTVVAVGEGYKYGYRFLDKRNREDVEWFPHAEKKPLTVQVGDVVLYAHRGGEDHVFEGVVYRITPEDHIDAVLEDEA